MMTSTDMQMKKKPVIAVIATEKSKTKEHMLSEMIGIASIVWMNSTERILNERKN